MKRLMVFFATALFSMLAAVNTAASDTMYGIGSVSKVFTAAAVMKLVEQGNLGFDEPVVTYIPELKMADARYLYITPRMLLDHSSGLMGSTMKGMWLLGDFDTTYIDSFLSYLEPQSLKHDPGERSIYCNDGFALAGILIERVSGMSFTDFVEHEFLRPLDIKDIKSPQSDFDRGRLADIYLGNNALNPQNLHAIGSGGLYSTMEDLVRYAAIFMDSADGSVLSKQSVDEMAKYHHQMAMIPHNVDTITNYGLGWDGVDTYPFNQYGVKALSKGGSTQRYNTNLTVLPEYNLAVAVASSGTDAYEHLIAQEIILAVLIEEGLIPADAGLVMPVPNLNRAIIPEGVKASADIYSAGMFGGMMRVEFTDDALIITPLAALNERPQVYIYNTDGEFVSTDGDYLGKLPGENTYGKSWITFEGEYLILQTYKEELGLSQSVLAMPFAEKVKENPVPKAIWLAWEARNGKEYLLVSEKHTSMEYLSPLAKILTDERIPGYVNPGIYRASGLTFPSTQIVDGNTAHSFIKVPTMSGRDGKDLSVTVRNGVEYLDFNYGDAVYMDASDALKFSELSDRVVIRDEAIWVDIDDSYAGRIVYVQVPQNSSWFVYDERMSCIATSLEKDPRDRIILPDNGRVVFVGEAGAEFLLN